MPAPVNGITGVNNDRSPASADVVAEARQRQTDRLRAAQAETAKPSEVVEAADKGDGALVNSDAARPYRVNLSPKTGRLYTDVLDTETGKVIMRIPPNYVDPAEEAAEAGIAAAPDDEVEL